MTLCTISFPGEFLNDLQVDNFIQFIGELDDLLCISIG